MLCARTCTHAANSLLQFVNVKHHTDKLKQACGCMRDDVCVHGPLYVLKLPVR